MRFIVTTRRCDMFRRSQMSSFPASLSTDPYWHSLVADHPQTSRNGGFFHGRKPLISCPKSWTLQWKGLNLYLAGVGSSNMTPVLRVSMILRLDKHQQIPSFIPPGFRINGDFSHSHDHHWLKSWLSLRKSHLITWEWRTRGAI